MTVNPALLEALARQQQATRRAIGTDPARVEHHAGRRRGFVAARRRTGVTLIHLGQRLAA